MPPVESSSGVAKAPSQRVRGEDLAVLRPRHVGVPCCHQDHRAESGAGGQQMIKLEGRPQREVESAASDSLERIGKRAEALTAEALRPHDDGHARHEPGNDSPNGPIQWLSIAHLRNSVVATSRATMPIRLKSWDPMRFSSDPLTLGGWVVMFGAGKPSAGDAGRTRRWRSGCRNLVAGRPRNSASCRSSESTRADRAASVRGDLGFLVWLRFAPPDARPGPWQLLYLHSCEGSGTGVYRIDSLCLRSEPDAGPSPGCG